MRRAEATEESHTGTARVRERERGGGYQEREAPHGDEPATRIDDKFKFRAATVTFGPRRDDRRKSRRDSVIEREREREREREGGGRYVTKKGGRRIGVNRQAATRIDAEFKFRAVIIMFAPRRDRRSKSFRERERERDTVLCSHVYIVLL